MIGLVQMKPIHASEVGSYLYCARAWAYRQQGVQAANQDEMSLGTDRHRQHGRQVLAMRLLRLLGLLLLLVALVLFAVMCTRLVL